MDVRLVVLDRGEGRRLLALRHDERVAARHETRHDASLLRRGGGGERLDARLLRPRGPGLPPRLGDAVAGLPDLRRDALVLPPDPREKLEVVEDVGERRRPDDEREHIGAVGHVEVAQALLEPREGDAVLAAEPLEARCLPCDRPVEGREPRACLRELSFEHGEARRLRVDPGLELAHAPGDGAEVLREHARLLLGRGSSVAEPSDLSVDACLLRPRIARRASRGAERRGEQRGGGRGHEAGATNHQPLFASARAVPASSRSSVRSACAASRRSGPTTLL